MAIMNFLRTYFKSILMYGVVVSGTAALAEWSSFAWCVYSMGMQYVLASILAFIVGTSVNAILSRYLAFNSRGRTGTQEIIFIYLTSAVAFFLNVAAMICIVELLHLNIMLGKIAGTIMAFFANYLLRQFFIFSAEPRWK